MNFPWVPIEWCCNCINASAAITALDCAHNVVNVNYIKCVENSFFGTKKKKSLVQCDQVTSYLQDITWLKNLPKLTFSYVL